MLKDFEIKKALSLSFIIIIIIIIIICGSLFRYYIKQKDSMWPCVCSVIWTLRKTRWQRQRERHQTKGLISRTMAVHVHYNSWYISLPSSAKQQREMTIFCVVW